MDRFRVILALAAIAPQLYVQNAGAQVTVYGTHQGGNVVYHYEVRNSGAGEIRRFYLGCECRAPGESGIAELQALPVNAQPVRTDAFGTWYELPADAVTQPGGWRTRLLKPHGSTGHWIEWYMPAAAKPGIPAGATVTGFSVTIAGADETYLVSRYTLHRQDKGVAAVSGALLLADTTPPQLSLTTKALSDAPGVTAQVHVNATATDDRDPEPRIAVESVGRPDDGAPAYTVVYSARDASGNRTTAEARIPLPAERPKAAPTSTLLRRASLP